MGYRSTIAIAISKKAILESLLKIKTLPNAFNTADVFDDSQKNAHYWIFESTKWYPTYTTIDAIEKFLATLNDDDYGFIRIGEDQGDVEILGNPWEYDMGAQTIISTPVGDYA